MCSQACATSAQVVPWTLPWTLPRSPPQPHKSSSALSLQISQFWAFHRNGILPAVASRVCSCHSALFSVCPRCRLCPTVGPTAVCLACFQPLAIVSVRAVCGRVLSASDSAGRGAAGAGVTPAWLTEEPPGCFPKQRHPLHSRRHRVRESLHSAPTPVTL